MSIFGETRVCAETRQGCGFITHTFFLGCVFSTTQRLWRGLLGDTRQYATPRTEQAVMHFLDTNLCIEVLRHHPPNIQKKLEETKEIGISTVVYGELCFGIALSPTKTQENRREQLQQFISLVSIYPWDEAAAEQYAIVRAYLQKKGTHIGNMDLLIAAHARSIRATLVTNNRREFARVPDLHIEDWSR